MFSYFAVQMPFSVCAVWFVLVLIKKQKNHSDRLMAWIMALLTVNYLLGSNHMFPHPDYGKLVYMDLIIQACILSVIPIICFYIRSLYEESDEPGVYYLSMLPAVFLPLATFIVTFYLGADRCALLLESVYSDTILPFELTRFDQLYLNLSFHYFHLLFYALIGLSLVFVFSKLFGGKFKFEHIASFLKGEKSSFVANIECSFLVIYFILWAFCIIFDYIFMDPGNPMSILWSIIVSVILFLVGYIAAIPTLPGGYLNMDRLRHPFNSMSQSRNEYLSGINSGPVAGSSLSGYDKIMDSFNQLMVVDKGYLNPSLTIDEISRSLGTNRTYVSKLVNIYYGLPFRDYLNKLRIDYSKNLMVDEPDAVIEYISVKSGFQSSTQFIRKFKELEGLTPSVWRSKTLNRQ